jgi:hypothetical protein
MPGQSRPMRAIVAIGLASLKNLSPLGTNPSLGREGRVGSPYCPGVSSPKPAHCQTPRHSNQTSGNQAFPARCSSPNQRPVSARRGSLPGRPGSSNLTGFSPSPEFGLSLRDFPREQWINKYPLPRYFSKFSFPDGNYLGFRPDEMAFPLKSDKPTPSPPYGRQNRVLPFPGPPCRWASKRDGIQFRPPIGS